MEWQKEVIYYVRGFSRNPDFPPKVWERTNRKTGNKFYPTDVKVARYNTKDKKYTEIGDYQFIIPYAILEEVKNYVAKDMAFYLVKGTDDKYKVYSNPNEIKDVQDLISISQELGDKLGITEEKIQQATKEVREEEVKPLQQDGDIAYILEFISNIDNTLNMILNAILEWRKDD